MVLLLDLDNIHVICEKAISLAFFLLLEAAYTPWLMVPYSHVERDHLSPLTLFPWSVLLL